MTEANTNRKEDFVDQLEEEWRAADVRLSTEATRVVARIMRLSYYIEQRVERNLALFGLSRGEFEVLSVILRNPGEAMTPKKIQARVLITSGGLSNRIKTLEAKGLLTREPDPADKRGVVLKLTEKGRAMAGKAARTHLQVEREILQGFEKEDAAALAGLLRKLILLQESCLNEGALP